MRNVLDLLSIQRSLTGLEERFNDLQEVAESRFIALLDERNARTKEKGEAQQQIADLKQQLSEKGAELQKVVGERDEQVKEKRQAQQQLGARSSQLLTAQNALNEKVAELQEIEEEYHHLRLRFMRQRGR